MVREVAGGFHLLAVTRQGRPELLGVIDEAMTAINTAFIRAPAANESSPSLSLPAPAWGTENAGPTSIALGKERVESVTRSDQRRR